MQLSKVLFLCIAFLALFLSLTTFLHSSFQYGIGFKLLLLLLPASGMLNSAALEIAHVKRSVFSLTELDSESKSAVSSLRELILNDS